MYGRHHYYFGLGGSDLPDPAQPASHIPRRPVRGRLCRMFRLLRLRKAVGEGCKMKKGH